MPEVAPFHDSQNTGTYHICSKCPVGLAIQLGNRRQGEGNRRLCDSCKALQASDGC